MKIKLLVFFLGLSVSMLAQTSEPTILSIHINGQTKPFNPKVPLQLSALDDDLVIQFQPHPHTQSQYFLENYDKSWGSSPYPIVRYTNLAGGDYILKIRTLQNNKLSPTLSFPIVAERSLTEEWWFLHPWRVSHSTIGHSKNPNNKYLIIKNIYIIIVTETCCR